MFSSRSISVMLLTLLVLAPAAHLYALASCAIDCNPAHGHQPPAASTSAAEHHGHHANHSTAPTTAVEVNRVPTASLTPVRHCAMAAGLAAVAENPLAAIAPQSSNIGPIAISGGVTFQPERLTIEAANSPPLVFLPASSSAFSTPLRI
jgi:hypothetical protein